MKECSNSMDMTFDMTMNTSLTKEKECFRKGDLFVYRKAE